MILNPTVIYPQMMKKTLISVNFIELSVRKIPRRHICSEKEPKNVVSLSSRGTLYLHKRWEDGLRSVAIQWKVIIEYYSEIFSVCSNIHLLWGNSLVHKRRVFFENILKLTYDTTYSGEEDGLISMAILWKEFFEYYSELCSVKLSILDDIDYRNISSLRTFWWCIIADTISWEFVDVIFR